MHFRSGIGGRRGFAAACAAIVAGGLWGGASPANASVAHVVQPGETLWTIAYANNLTTRTVAVFNGLAEDATLVEGQTIDVPTVDEGAAALVNAGITPGSDGSTSTSSGGGVEHTVVWGESLWSVATANGISVEALAAANGLAADAYLIEGQTISIPAAGSGAPPGLASIPAPCCGDLYLTPEAASQWNAMREDSIANHGVDLYPGGPASAYRTTEQQQQLYDLYLSGRGEPANPPGTSTHEQGIAVDVAEPIMRDVIDQIGGAYGWSGTIPSEWWHVQYGW
jgi:LysM repeat protein